MSIKRTGYACINNTLAEAGIQVNRMMVKRTFEAKGIDYASSLALKNIQDLARLIDWNIKNGIEFYRMSSDMFPWMSEYELDALPDIVLIKRILMAIGEKTKTHNLRLTFHPGPFNVLASKNESVVLKTVKELRQHGEIMDMIDLPRNAFAKINIHVGGAYGNKSEAIERFNENFKRLPATASSRLTIENDDKANMFSVADLVAVHESCGIPIVFDYLHHKFCTGDLSEEEAFKLAISTWPERVTPAVHFSSEKKIYEDKNAVATAHADFVYTLPRTYGHDVDVMLEAKAKELALERFQSQFRSDRVTA